MAEVVPLDSERTPAPPRHDPRARTIRVGLIGLGNVGQAVARLAPHVRRLDPGGLRFTVASALVRDVSRARRCPKPSRLTSNAEAFLRGNYDVVIEALGAIEPARTIVARLLGRSIPVVTANKSLVAAHGPELAALAAHRGAPFRYEASALAGVPFLGALSERPFVAAVSRFAAVVNGTSNFILATLDAEGCSFDAALARAQQLGLTEPDPSRDLDGLDAADKFALLASIFGWGRYTPQQVEVRGIRGLRADDLAAARELGGTIKPVVAAARTGSRVDAFVGPAFVPAGHPLATLAGTLSGIQLTGRYVSDLFFSGPGAGPDITAATLLDDAIEAVGTTRRFLGREKAVRPAGATRPPETAWLVRVRFPGVLPEATAVQTLFSSVGMNVTRATRPRDGGQWLLVERGPAHGVTRALAQLRHTHRIESHAVRSLS